MTSELGSVLLCRARRKFSFLSLFILTRTDGVTQTLTLNAYSTANSPRRLSANAHHGVFALGVHWNTYGSEPSALAHRSTGTW